MVQNYSGRVSLFISYQWDLTDNAGSFRGTDEATLFSGTFDNIDDAYARMEQIIPNDYVFDDGQDLQEWPAAPGPDAFTQYAAYLDNEHCVLAILRPIA